MRTFYLIAGAVATAYVVYQYFFADDQDDRPQSRPETYKPSQPPVHRRHERQQRHWQNIDSSQRDHVTPAAYAGYQYFFADDQNDRPPSRHETYKPSQPPVHRRDERQQRHWQSIDSSQRDHVTPAPYAGNQYFADDRPPSRPETYKPSQPPVHRRDERQQGQTIDSSQRDHITPAAYAGNQYFADDRPPSRPETYKSSQPPVHRRDERQQRQSIDSSQRDHITPAAYAGNQYFADDQNDHPPSRLETYKSSQPPVLRRDERQQRQTIDSSQGDHITPEDPATLRARAKQEGDLMSQCYQQSQEAYERRDHARAKAFSAEGKHHALKVEMLNAEASATIFQENNRDRDPRKVDLHGLYVKEAIAYSEKAVAGARQSDYPEVRLIVGQGNHSENGIPRLKPALQEAMLTCGHHVEADPKNPGVLVVRLGSK